MTGGTAQPVLKELRLDQVRLDAFRGMALDPAVLAEWTAYYRGEIGCPSPYALFAEITYIHTEAQRDAILGACFAVPGYVAAIDYHPDYGWVFHTLYGPERTWRKRCAEWFPQENSPRSRSEERIENALCEHLRGRGIAFERQVRCGTGIADVVTATCVYEVKADLAGHILFQAIGQVLVYRAALASSLQPVVIARGIDERAVQAAAKVGVWMWDADHALRDNRLR